MAERRPLHVLVTALCGVLIAAGAAACSGGSGSSSATTASSGADAATSEAAPAPEQTNPEQPQPPQGKPGVEVVSLPVGGGGPSQNPDCIDVRWSDPAFRDGVKIVISDVRVTGDFEEQGTSCDTPCRNYVFSSDQGSCQVRVGYAIPQTPRDLNGTVELGGNCVAPDDATCQKVKEDVANAPGHVVHLGVSADELPQNPGNSASQS